MELIIIGFHIALVVSIILFIQAVRERKKQQALEAKNAQESNGSGSQTSSLSSNANSASTATSTIASAPISEQQKAVQLVHDGLAHVVDHLSHLGSVPEMSLTEANAKASATANSQADATTHAAGNGNGSSSSTAEKVCPSCNEPWDSAFDFCLKCSHK